MIINGTQYLKWDEIENTIRNDDFKPYVWTGKAWRVVNDDNVFVSEMMSMGNIISRRMLFVPKTVAERIRKGNDV